MMLAIRFCGYKGVGNMIVTKELLDELTVEAEDGDGFEEFVGGWESEDAYCFGARGGDYY